MKTEVGSKGNPLITVRRLVLFAIIFTLSFITKLYDFDFIYGITYTLSTLFLLLIVRLYGFKVGLLTSVVLHFTVVLLFQAPVWDIIFIFEMAFIGALMYYSRKCNMVIWDLVFWLVIGIPLSILYYTYFTAQLSGTVLHLQLFNKAINALSNALVADIILAYIPLYRWLNGKDRTYQLFNFHQFIFHLLVGAIVFPFLLNVSINSWNSYQSSINLTNQTVVNTANSIEKEMEQWREDDLKRLSLMGAIQMGYLTELIERTMSEEYYEIVFTNDQQHVVASNNKESDYLAVYEWRENNDVEPLNSNLYLLLPKEAKDDIPIAMWSQGSYIYEKSLGNPPMTLYIQVPVSHAQTSIFNDILDQVRFLIFFSICAVVLSLIIKRYLGNTLSQLAQTTTGLPAKIKAMETIQWPDSQVSEVFSLINNFKYMSNNLKQMFHESYELNTQLENQANMLQKSEEKLQRLAYYDILTELPNRQHFQQYLSGQIKTSKKVNKQLAVIFIDINQFKQINDTLGHSFGDQLLKLIAGKFERLQTDTIRVFRLGGDEFVIVMNVESKEKVEQFGEKIIHLFSEPMVLKDLSLYITASVGISMYPNDGDTLDKLVKYADIAMYKSKEKGRNYIQFFDGYMKNNFSKRMVLNNGLQEALEQNQFELFYQPKIDTFTGYISGMEALMRWNDPQLGIVSPATFIPIAEESGLILKIDEWGLIEACKQNKKWQDAGLGKIPVAVNISVKHFYQGHLLEMVRKALVLSGLESQYLRLEITESLFINHNTDVIDIIEELKYMGVKVAIDDFGNGYSSLIHLLKLPIYEVKLDRAFIKDLHVNSKKGSMVKAVLELARSLELNVVAEGVEVEEEWKYLQHLKCDEIQGYLFSKPLSKDKFKAFLELDEALQREQNMKQWGGEG